MITSTSNSRIKHIRALRQRKEREQSGLFFIEGIRIVGEAVQMGAEIETLIVAPEQLSSDFGLDLVAAQRARGGTVLEVSPHVFGSLSSKEGPQGLAAVVRQRWEGLDEIRPAGDEIWVALDSPQDPGNVGTILRTADAVGASGLILLDHFADPYDPAAVRASMGAIFSQRLARSATADFARWKEARRIAVVGTSDRASRDYQEAAYPAPVVLLMGSEREGLSAEQQAMCDSTVSIPMAGRSDSLNLAVATAVVLYEIFNQRRRGL